jgi:hypothetical protein
LKKHYSRAFLAKYFWSYLCWQLYFGLGGRLTDINHGKLGCIKIINILSYRIGFDFNSFR